MRWLVRVLGLASVVILARLLGPEDFGLVAMAMVIVQLMESLSDFGVETALIRDKNAGDDHFHTAWTIRQAQFVVIAAVVFAISPAVAGFYDEEAVELILPVLGLAIALRGFENIGIVNFQKSLNFSKDFKFNVLTKLLTIGTTITLAVHLRSYWALVLGSLSGSIYRVIASYIMSEFRPRWCLRTWRELWAFSQWVLARGVAQFVNQRADVVLLGRMTSAGSLGLYTVAKEIAELPATEISMPISRAVLPGLAKLVDDPSRMGRAFLKVIAAVATVVVPVSLGILVVADDAIRLLLGSQWIPMVPVLQIFCIFAIFMTLRGIAGNMLVVAGYIRYSTYIVWFQAIMFLAFAVPAFRLAELSGMAALHAALTAIGFVLYVLFVARNSTVTIKETLVSIVRPTIAGGVMVAVVICVEQLLAQPGESSAGILALNLTIEIMAGVVAYSSTLYLAWRCAGRPDGLESSLVDHLSFSRKSD